MEGTQLSPAAGRSYRVGRAMTQELRQDIHRRVHAVQQRYHRGGPLLRALWLFLAVLLTLTGLAMTVLPGPAIVVIPLGLAMLAVRFRWAQATLQTAIEYGVWTQRRVVARSSAGNRMLWRIAGVLALVALAVVVFW
jgi:hypothetical protein